jgi:hypothetical protein
MTAARHLRVVDQDGEVFEFDHADPVEENKALRAALVRAENSNRALKALLAEQRQQARRTHPIDEAFEDHKAKLVAAGLRGKARCRLTDDRVDAMARMFDAGYTLADFGLVSSGVAACRFVVYGTRCQHGPLKDERTDLAYVCEKARRFEEAARLGALVERARNAETAS